MSELTQADANLLFGMDKHRADDNLYKFPDLGGVLIVPLVSADGRENFILDIHRGRINLRGC